MQEAGVLGIGGGTGKGARHVAVTTDKGQNGDQHDDADDGVHHIAGGLCQQLGAIQAQQRGDQNGDPGGDPVVDAEEALQQLALTGESQTAGTHHGHQEADIIQNGHHAAEFVTIAGLGKGAVAGGAVSAGVLQHVVHNAAGDQHSQQGRYKTHPAVLHIPFDTESTGGEAGAEVAAQPYGGHAQKCGYCGFFLFHDYDSFLFHPVQQASFSSNDMRSIT